MYVETPRYTAGRLVTQKKDARPRRSSLEARTAGLCLVRPSAPLLSRDPGKHQSQRQQHGKPVRSAGGRAARERFSCGWYSYSGRRPRAEECTNLVTLGCGSRERALTYVGIPRAGQGTTRARRTTVRRALVSRACNVRRQ